MGRVAVSVNGREFAIACADGEEERIRRLAEDVDRRVGAFIESIGQAGEARLLLLAALVIADELADAREALEQERRRAQEAVEAAAGNVHGIAERIEAIAARLETS